MENHLLKKGVFLLAFISSIAFAGKTEREFFKNTVQPAIANAEAAYKKACGCSLRIQLDSAAKNNENALDRARHIADSIQQGVTGYCTDAESKKAICAMKTLEIIYDKAKTEFTFDGKGAGKSFTDGTSIMSFEVMAGQLDK